VGGVPAAWKLKRGSALDIGSYDLVVDLTGNRGMFLSRTEIRFGCRRPGTTGYADLHADSIRRAVLNGAELDLTAACRPGSLELPRLAAENTLIVEAEFGFVSAGAGLHRVTGPDGGACVYSKAYPGGAPRIYCCFDQPELRAPFTVAVIAPAGWSCMGNGPVVSRPAGGDPGPWKFAATPPIAPYLSSFCAGPFAGAAFTCESGLKVPVPVTVSALSSAAAALAGVVSPELFQQPLAYYERSLATPYPYGKCDAVFVPGYPGLAFGAPGLVTVKEQALTQPPAGEPGLYLATVIAHELAHAWLGGLIQFQPPGAGWLEEAITTYVSRTALEETRPGATPWAAPVSRVLPDHAYVSGAEKIRQLENLIGRQAILAGLRDLLHRHAHGGVTTDGLVHYWSIAGRRDLRQWAAETLMPATANDPPGAAPLPGPPGPR
jgi:aminopeptidase N